MYITVKHRETGETAPMVVLESRGFFYAFKTEYIRVCAQLNADPDFDFTLLIIVPGQVAAVVRIFDSKQFIGNIYTALHKGL